MMNTTRSLSTYNQSCDFHQRHRGVCSSVWVAFKCTACHTDNSSHLLRVIVRTSAFYVSGTKLFQRTVERFKETFIPLTIGPTWDLNLFHTFKTGKFVNSYLFRQSLLLASTGKVTFIKASTLSMQITGQTNECHLYLQWLILPIIPPSIY